MAVLALWILERRHQDGRWEAVQADERLWAEGLSPEAARADPRHTLTARHAGRIALLSGVPSLPPGRPPVAAPGVPTDVSPWTRALLTKDWEGSEERWLDASHLQGLDVEEADLALNLAVWIRALETVLDGPLGAVPMAARSAEDHLFDDLAGRESAHARLARETRALGLLPPRAPGAWRILLRHTW